MQNDSAIKTLTVAGILCIICSVLVSTAAVKLKPMQDENKKLDIKKNLLLSAGLIDSPKVSKDQIEDAFKVVETKVIDIDTGDYVDMDPESYDQMSAASDPKMSKRIDGSEDYAAIGKREKLSKVFFIKDGARIKNIILPVYGKGLWSTMYGFLVLEPDTTTVAGIGFYQHGETPGLGGEIDNPKWKSTWKGKKVYRADSDNFEPALHVIKGMVEGSTPDAEYKIDGLAGATLTSNGVTGMVKYWLGNSGFAPFLKKLRQVKISLAK